MNRKITLLSTLYIIIEKGIFLLLFSIYRDKLIWFESTAHHLVIIIKCSCLRMIENSDKTINLSMQPEKKEIEKETK